MKFGNFEIEEEMSRLYFSFLSTLAFSIMSPTDIDINSSDLKLENLRLRHFQPEFEQIVRNLFQLKIPIADYYFQPFQFHEVESNNDLPAVGVLISRPLGHEFSL